MDIGLVHDQDNHQFGRTWVMLTNEDTSVMGYLKISLTVLGAVPFILKSSAFFKKN